MSSQELVALQSLPALWPPLRGVAEELPAGLQPHSCTAGPARWYDAAALAVRLADSTAFALTLRGSDGRKAHAVVSGAAAVALTAALLAGRSDELNAPRRATRAERGVCAFVAAALLDAWGGGKVAVELPEGAAGAVATRLQAGAVGVELDLLVGGVHSVVLLLAASRLPAGARAPSVAQLSKARGERVAAARVRLAVVTGRGRVSLRGLRALTVRDVLLFDEAPSAQVARLLVGNGAFAVEVDSGQAVDAEAACAKITSEFEPGACMSDRETSDPTTSEQDAIAEEVSVEVCCQLGAVVLTARQVLELSPGAVLALGTPVGGSVELVVGGQQIGRGELVDVDGEVGVRILQLTGTATAS